MMKESACDQINRDFCLLQMGWVVWECDSLSAEDDGTADMCACLSQEEDNDRVVEVQHCQRSRWQGV